MAETTAAGKRWQRVHVIRQPLSDYMRFELGEYRANVEAGEDVSVAVVDTHPELAELTDDFWLFDADTTRSHAVLLRYDDAGRMVGFERTIEPSVLGGCLRDRDFAFARAVPLSQYPGRLEA